MTTEEAVAVALNNSRQLESLDTRVAIQEYRLLASRIDNPELRIRNLTTRSVDRDFDELAVGIRWAPPIPGEVAEEHQEAQVTFWQQKVQARRARHWLASRVRRACADVILYRELVRIAEERMGNETRRIAQIKTMVELGQRSIVYYTNAKTMVIDARNEYTRHLQALRGEERRLQRLTGAPESIDVVLEPLPQVTAPEDTLLSIAYSHRPEVQLVGARQLLAIRRQESERWRRWPSLSYIEASRQHERGTQDWYELRLGVEIPLFGRDAGEARATQLGVARKETEALAIRERIEDEVHDRFAAYNEARLAWQLSRDDGQLFVEDASRLIAKATAHGTVPADEVLELERTILDTQVMAARRRRELAHAMWFLYYALGIDGPEQTTTSPAR